MPSIARAQSAVETGKVVTLEQDRLLQDTLYGRAIAARIAAETQALTEENRVIEQAFQQEEQDLTNKRATMAADAFRVLADDFDKRVEDTRQAQVAKLRALSEQHDVLRKGFFDSVTPVLGDYMLEIGAVAILSKSAVVMSLGSIDITDEAIARVDERLKDGGVTPPTSGPTSAPSEAPTEAP